MLFCRLGGAKSRREIHEGLRAREGRLPHLELTEAPPNRPGHVVVLYWVSQ